MLEEVVAATPLNRAASFAFALSRCVAERPVMVVLPLAEARECGRPGVFGVSALHAGSPLLLVSPRTVAEALWTMEQALKSGALGGVLGMVEGATLTQSRRLDFAARDGGTFAGLLRVRGDELSAVRLHAELLRQRDGPPGDWVLEHTAGGFAVAAGLAAQRPREDQRRAA